MKLDISNRKLFNYKYIPIIRNTKRHIFLMGSAGSGKSTFQAQKEVSKLFEKNSRLMCVRKVHATLKESCFAELVGVIEDWKLTQYFDITRSPLYIRNKLTGSDVLFRGMDNAEKIKSIRRVKRVWCEEATELSKGDFNQLDLRLRGSTGLQMTCTFNPVDEDSWLNTEFWEHGNTDSVELLQTTFLDNRWVGEEYSQVMERLKEQDPKMYEIYALGKWGKAVEWLIFDYTEIAEVPEEATLLGYGMDFGFTNDPTTLIALYRWNGSIIMDELIYKTHLTNSDIIRELRELGISESTPIFGDSAEPKSIEDISRAGFNIKSVVKWPDSIRYGIDTMNQQPMIVTARSGNTKKELKKYCWAKDKNGKVLNVPIDVWNHAIDGGRYAYMMLVGKRKRELKSF